MGSFAADHLIRDAAAFVEAVREAMAGAAHGLLMTVGITPDPARDRLRLPPVRRRRSAPAGARRWRSSRRSPPYDVAERLRRRPGGTCGTPSMFVWRVDVFLAELARQQPELHAGLVAIAAAWGTDEQEEVLGEVWPTLPRISVDYAVMEGAAAAGRVGDRARRLRLERRRRLPHPRRRARRPTRRATSCSDAGTEDEAGGAAARRAEHLVVVPQSGRLVAALGVRDLVIVDTRTRVLVCPRDRAQDVKRLVDELKERGEPRYI